VETRIVFGSRLGACVIDFVLVCIIAFVAGGPIGAMLGAGVGASMSHGDADATKGMAMGGFIGLLLGIVVAAAVVGTIYFLIEGFTGWTFGKLILGIQVGSQDGTRASTGQLLGRYALKNCNFILSLLAAVTGISILKTFGFFGGIAIFIGCFFVLGAAKQAFHDMIAKTAVYKRTELQAA